MGMPVTHLNIARMGRPRFGAVTAPPEPPPAIVVPHTEPAASPIPAWDVFEPIEVTLPAQHMPAPAVESSSSPTVWDVFGPSTSGMPSRKEGYDTATNPQPTGKPDNTNTPSQKDQKQTQVAAPTGLRRWTRRLMLVGGFVGALMLPDVNSIKRTVRELVGSTSQPPAASRMDSLPKLVYLPVPKLYQGDTNACGTTSLAMAVNGVDNAHATERENLDDKMRRWDIYSAPDLLVQTAREVVPYAEIYNNSTFEEIAEHLSKGNPVIALIKSGQRGKDFKAHYVTLCGYEVDASGNRWLMVQDPARYVQDPKNATPMRQSFEEFQKDWHDIDMIGVHTGYNNLIIVLSKNVLPPSRGPINPLNNLATNTAQMLNTVASIARGDFGTVVTQDLSRGNLMLLVLLGLTLRQSTRLGKPARRLLAWLKEQSFPMKPTPPMTPTPMAR